MAAELQEHHLRGVAAALDHAESRLGCGIVKASEMAWYACMSPYHFERVFQRVVGLTPGELRRHGILPSLTVPRFQLPPDAVSATVPLHEARARFVQVPTRFLVGLSRRGENEHGTNMGLDYRLLLHSAGRCDPERWLYFDRLHPQPPHYEMFMGWEVPTLSRIPDGLECLEIPKHPALLVAYRGRFDDHAESLVREHIREETALRHGVSGLPDAWKLTRSSACGEGAGHRDWEIEIPLA